MLLGLCHQYVVELLGCVIAGMLWVGMKMIKDTRRCLGAHVYGCMGHSQPYYTLVVTFSWENGVGMNEWILGLRTVLG